VTSPIHHTLIAMPQMPAPALQRTFWCFISYRHADNKEPGRQWATWLHQMIETYEVPSDLVGTTNERGDTIPERIYPVFRDEEELPVDADLATPIFRALDVSKFLLVICSPRAVASTYVAQEISYFKQLGREDRVLAAMIDGVPNASNDPARADLECFPLPLRHRVDAQGTIMKEIAEPVAADFRLDDFSQGWCSPEALRQEWKDAGKLSGAQIEQCVTNYQQRCELMKLKIIAGVLGIPLGTLTQRDKAYQLELSRKRAKRLRQWLAAVALLGIFAIAGAIIATQQARIAREQTILAEQQATIARQQSKIAQEQTIIAEQQRAEAQKQTVIATENLVLARKSLAETHYKEASRLVQGAPGNILPAVESMVASLESDPTFGPSRRMLEHEMATREWCVPLTQYTASAEIKKAWLDAAGEQAFILQADAKIRVVHLGKGHVVSTTDLAPSLPIGTDIISAACSPAQQQIALLCQIPKKRTFPDDEGDSGIDWSWQLYVFTRNGALIGSDALASSNLDRGFYASPNQRADRLADQPLFFSAEGLLLLINAREIIGWNSNGSTGGLRYLGSQKLALPPASDLSEWLFGWEYSPSDHSLRYLTNRQVIHQSIANAAVLQRTVFAQEPDEMFPAPNEFSGMVSFGAGTRGAISGLVDVSFQMPEGIGAGMPRDLHNAEEQYRKTFTTYDGVFQFTPSGGWMHFNDQIFDYSPTTGDDAKGKFQVSFPTSERTTEWPPFLMCDHNNSVLLLSIVQSGSMTPQLLEIIHKPDSEKQDYEIPQHRGISQILDGKTCWISADGSKLAQINGGELTVYRIGWQAKATTPKATANAKMPLSFSSADLMIDDKPVPPPQLDWDNATSPAALKHKGKSFPLPVSLTPSQAVAAYPLALNNLHVVVFGKPKAVGDLDYEDPYEKRFRLWVIHPQNGTAYLSDWISSFSVDAREKLLATCTGTKVRIIDLEQGKEIRSFTPRRLSNHMSAPAQAVFFSLDSHVLGVSSLSSVQDYVIDHRAFDVETGSEYLITRAGHTVWHFDLFPQQKPHQIQEWRDGTTPSEKIPFFLPGYERDFVNALMARPSETVKKYESSQKDNASHWTILQWPDFAR
jgi:hypothetical protein